MTRTTTAAAADRGAVAWATAELAAAGCVSAAAEARWLVEEAADPAALRAMVARRAAGAPLQYVIGWAPFGRLRLRVGPGVFVPRPETEGLADRAAAHLRAAGAAGEPVAVDLCTGSGAIACFLAAEVPGARVVATELDPGALAWAAARRRPGRAPSRRACRPGRRAVRQRPLRAHPRDRHHAEGRPRPRAVPGP
jgi:release factor glutamine methyltransferase